MTCFPEMPVIETVHKDNHDIGYVDLKSEAVMGTSLVRFWCFCHKLFIEIVFSLISFLVA